MRSAGGGDDTTGKLNESDGEMDDGECGGGGGGSSDDSSCSSNDESGDDDRGGGGGGGTDTSDLDLEQCVRRKSACLRQLCELERQFAVLKQQLFDEKMAVLRARLAAVEDGSASELTAPLQRLDDAYRQRQQTAAALRRLRLVNCRHRYDSELLAAGQHLRSEHSVLALHMRAEIEERLRRLEEDRRQVDVIGADLWCNGDGGVGGGGSGGEKRRRRRAAVDTADADARSPSDEPCGGGGGGARRRRRVLVSGPYIVYMLDMADVMQDWTTIKKALAGVKRKGDFKILRDVHATWGF